MKSVRFICLFAIFVSTLVLAQSNRAQLVNLPNGKVRQAPRPGLPQNPSYMPQRAAFAQSKAEALNAVGSRWASPPSSGLDFENAVDYGSGGELPYSVAVSDVNGDGKADLIVTDECAGANCGAGADGVVGVLLGNGNGTFQTAVTYDSGGYTAQSVAVGDLNGDGKPDLVVANSNSNTVGVLLNNGDGTFQTAVTYPSGGYDAYSVAVADVNGDGKLDVIVASLYVSNNDNSGTVGVLLGNGDGTFQPVVTYGSGGYQAYSVAVADVNGDGKLDLLVANFCAISDCLSSTNGSVGVLLGNGDGTFQTAVPYDSGGYGTFSVVVADVNGDGKPDLVVANECAVGRGGCGNNDAGVVGVLLGNGNGTFQTAVPYGSGGDEGFSVAVQDVNGDGKPDVVVANYCAGTNCDDGGGLGVLLGNGDGTFQTAVSYSSGGYGAASAAVADVNGDGKPDLLVVNVCATFNGCPSSGGTVGVLINTSITGTSTLLTSSPNPSNFGQPVTFTATVTAQKGFYKGIPTGKVSFYDGPTKIGSSNLNSSEVATLTTSKLTVGTHKMTAKYEGDTNFAPSTSPVLHQVVDGAVVSLSPTHLNFGKQTVGIASSPEDVSLKNTGDVDLKISEIQITGADSGDFSQNNNCPSSLPPEKSCTIKVTFTPTTTGSRQAAVSITDNAPGSPQVVPLKGIGVLPAVKFAPTSLKFDTQLVHTSSPPQKVTMTNTGEGILTISSITVTGSFTQTNNCPSSLKPNAFCTINVKFHPTTKGVQNGSVNVADNAPGSPQQVPLTGTGTFVQLLPANVRFGTQPVGTRSVPRKITLFNKGDSAMNITGISITGTDAGDFSETNTCGSHLASGGHCLIKVTFKPLAKGKRIADVSVYDDGGGSPQDVGLTGTGT